MSIQALPHEILFKIFESTISISRKGQFAYGANVASWDSNEEAIAYRLVCKAWSQPGLFPFFSSVSSLSLTSTFCAIALRVALQSVALFQKISAQKFLHQLSLDPSRSTVYLALGASEEDDEDLSLEENSERLLIESIEFTRVITAVSSSLTHLHLHPLHVKARDFLLPAIRACQQLKTLVISPRFSADWNGSTWGENLFARTDVVEFSLPPQLERLELDFASTWSAPFPVISSQAQSNMIKSIWLNCDCEEHALWQVLTSSQALELCQLYFERLLEINGYVLALSSCLTNIIWTRNLRWSMLCRTVQALLNSTSTMKRLHFTSK